MSDESDPLTKLAESVADGEPIDWSDLDALAADPSLKALVSHLRIVAGVGDVHRSQVDPVDSAAAGEAPRASADDRELPPSNFPLADDASLRWGHLALIRKIGEGAFGEVYLAHDTWLDHPRALKLLKPEVASRIGPNQLLHEARKLVRVRHPNVVSVHGADRHDGRIGFWMDYIDGPTLAERLADGRLGAGEATFIGQELCRALAAVHLQNLVHRDIKAQNVMRSADDGRIILMDFGAGEFIDLPRSGRPQGTPLYLAPELFARQPATVQSDIYALGVLLYYLVTGGFPVDGRSVDELESAHREGRRSRLRAVRPDLPAPFVDVVERAMDPDPARRFASAADLHDALGTQSSVASHGPTVNSRQTPVDSYQSPVTSRQSVLRALSLTVAALVAIEAVGYLGWRTFETTLHVDAEFAGTPLDFFRVGSRGIVGFVIYWLAGGVLLAILHSLDVVVGAPVGRRCHDALSRLTAASAARVAAAVCVAGAVAWFALGYAYWGLFSTLFELQLGAASTSPGLRLTPVLREWHVGYSGAGAWLTMTLLAALVWLFPALEIRCPNPRALRAFRWAAAALVALFVVPSAATWRIVQDEFVRVTFQARPSFVIGERDDTVLVYQPDRPGEGAVRVRRNDPSLVFEQRKPQRLVDPL